VARAPTPNTGSWSGLVGGYGAAALSNLKHYSNICFEISIIILNSLN